MQVQILPRSIFYIKTIDIQFNFDIVMSVKPNTRLAWRIKTITTMGKLNLATRVHNNTKRPGYNRHRERTAWSKESQYAY